MLAGYREHRVDRRLEPFVACYWTHEVAGGVRSSHPVMPDGCIDLLFHSGTGTLNVVGTMTRTMWAEDCGPTQFVGVRFKPGGAVPFLRDRADRLTDDTADAHSVFGNSGSELQQQLSENESVDEGIRQLEFFLLRQLRSRSLCVDSRIAWACSRLCDDPTNRTNALALELGVSRQYLRRLFLRHTGLSPKAFARVARLRRLVDQLSATVSLVDAAIGSGYSDQAHMSREFKSLVGITPSTYRTRH